MKHLNQCSFELTYHPGLNRRDSWVIGFEAHKLNYLTIISQDEAAKSDDFTYMSLLSTDEMGMSNRVNIVTPRIFKLWK